MAVLKCKMCGATLTVNEADTIVQCRYCESMQTLPNLDDELKMKLFDRATELRLACDFDQAAGVFQGIIAQFPEEAEAYWGLVLCKYGIEYVDDPRDGKKVPTCHRTRSQSVLLDSDYAAACEYAQVSRWKYEEEAQVIDGLQQKILAISRAEEPYDVFICYKETDDVTRVRTEDSMTAQDIYTELTTKGYKVFYSRVSLRGKAGSEYEPYIYAALSSAKVMLVIGSKKEFFEAVWLKNEWSRYLGMMEDGDKVLIPCYDTIEPEQLPRRLRGFQALNIHDVMFWPNLFTNIERVIGKASASQPAAPTATAVSNDVAPLLRRAELFLEDGDWQGAEDYCEKVLDIDPECAKAYAFKLLAKYKKNSIKQLDVNFEADPLFKKAIRFADDELKTALETALVNGKAKAEKKACAEAKRKAQEEAKQKAREEAERKAWEEAERKAYEEAERKAREEKMRRQKEIQLREYNIMCSRMIAAGWHTVGLKADGTVVAAGDNKDGQCNVSAWKDITAIAAGGWHTVGLKADGTVVAAGNNRDGLGNVVNRCNVFGWNNITAIAAGSFHSVGLKTNGTVVAVGDNGHGQCDLSSWNNITAIAANGEHTIGLKADGTVVAAGWSGVNMFGKCNLSDWRHIKAIATGLDHAIGLKEDGTVVAVGDNRKLDKNQCDVRLWKDIVAIAAGGWHTVGLKADGTVVAVGDNGHGQCDVSSWKNIVAIAAGWNHTAGLQADGTIIAVGDNTREQCDVGRFKLFDDIATLKNTLEQTRRDGIVRLQHEAEKRANLRAQGLCQHCGGEFKGLFIKKCICCGKTKDY